MLYEFSCPKKHTFEKLLPVYRRDEPQKCPTCGEEAKRQFATGTRHIWVGPPEWASAWKAGKVF